MYAKIFMSIFEGSMRGQSDLILVFVNLLCHADQDGMVDRHWRAIADETGLTHDQVRSALAALEGPDNESRSRNDDGRRLRRIDPERDWGWEIVNYKHYRALRTAQERREYQRDYKRAQRKKAQNAESLSTIVNNCQQCQPIAEAEAYAEAEEEGAPPPSEPTKDASLTDLYRLILDCRPEFRLKPEALWLNALRTAPLPVVRLAVKDYVRDMTESLVLPYNPLKLLRGYICKARTAPQFTGVQNVTDTVQRANDLAQARTEYAAVETWRTDPPKWAKHGDADKKQREILAGIAAKYGPDAAAEVRKPKEEQV